MPEMPIVDLSDDQPDDRLTPDQHRRVTLAHEAAAILRQGRATTVLGTGRVGAHDVACLADYLERGMDPLATFDLGEGGDPWPPEPVPAPVPSVPGRVPMPGPLDPDPREDADQPSDDDLPDGGVEDGMIHVLAHDLREGDRSPDWTILEMLAVDPSEGPIVRARVQFNLDGGREPREWDEDEDIALLERGPELPDPDAEEPGKRVGYP
jgi:hypothetical protein